MGSKIVWIALALMSLWVPGTAAGVNRPLSPITMPRVIRFRVIANSDSPIDQAVKLDVRDSVLTVLESHLVKDHSESQAMATLARVRGEVARVANQVLSQLGVRYRAQVLLTRTLFPTKVYGTWVLPAGRYQALLIKLGAADGHNWWCVLYPSLCFIDMTNGVAVPERAAASLRPGRVRLRKDAFSVSWRVPKFIREISMFFHNV